MKTIYSLHQNWILKKKQAPKSKSENLSNNNTLPEGGIPAEVPGTVHTDLLNAGLIKDPHYADNELSLEWIAESEWIYEKYFDFPENMSVQKPVYLIFEGLDTIADVYLNDKLILNARNMFKSHRIEIGKILKAQKNHLKILFNSPMISGQELEEKYGKLPVALNSSRVYLRKAQYSYGWDWGPSFCTSGIWRPVYLLQPDKAVIENIDFNTISLEKNTALIKVYVELKSEVKEIKGYLNIKLWDDEKTIEKHVILSNSLNSEIDLKVLNPALWWPNGSGNAHLYNLEITLKDESGKVLDNLKKKVGIRIIELQTEENKKNVFRFVVNHQKIFMKGANWIPADSFLPRIPDGKYRKLLQLAASANMNMIRVWGGGIYENDCFYEYCDEMGIIVWQDFMFACAAYPEHESFLNEVREEAAQNIKRLRSHPSLGIWCGNNENEWIWYQEQSKPVLEMPGYKIYHTILPELLKKLDPHTAYWPSSPFGTGDDPNDMSSGNRHQWDIWSRWIDYTEVKKDKSLFVTEFGFQGPANYHTFKKVIPDSELHPQSRIFEFHNKQIEGPERVMRFLSGHLPVSTDLADFIYLAQLNQALALKTCLSHWRLRWPETAGSVIWQLNDCWPVTSWALIDSELRPKTSFYFVKNIFSPAVIAFQQNEQEVDIILSNLSDRKVEGTLEVARITLPGGEISEINKIPVSCPEAINEVVMSLIWSETMENGNSILVATLSDHSGTMISRDIFSSLRFKHLKLPEPELMIRSGDKDRGHEDKIVISSRKAALFVNLTHPEAYFSDNGLIILPGEEYVLDITYHSEGTKINPKEIEMYSLNNYLSTGQN